MKTFNIVALLAAVTRLTASPFTNYSGVSIFTILTIRSCGFEIHLHHVKVNGKLSWIGKELLSSTSVPEACPCPLGDVTVVKAGSGRLALATIVPGAQ